MVRLIHCSIFDRLFMLPHHFRPTYRGAVGDVDLGSPGILADVSIAIHIPLFLFSWPYSIVSLANRRRWGNRTYLWEDIYLAIIWVMFLVGAIIVTVRDSSFLAVFQGLICDTYSVGGGVSHGAAAWISNAVCWRQSKGCPGSRGALLHSFSC